MKKRIFLLMVLSVFAVFGFEGCAATSTTKTEPVTTHETKRDSMESSEASPQSENTSATKAEGRTEVEEKKTEGVSGGILSRTLNFIGNVLAFPFRVVAGAIALVF